MCARLCFGRLEQNVERVLLAATDATKSQHPLVTCLDDVLPKLLLHSWALLFAPRSPVVAWDKENITSHIVGLALWHERIAHNWLYMLLIAPATEFALLALAAQPPVPTDAASSALLASTALPAVLTDAASSALLAFTALPPMFTMTTPVRWCG